MKEYIENRIKELQQAKQKHMNVAIEAQANANACEGAIMEYTSLLKKIEDKEFTTDK
jgi:hypothetical protein